MNHNFSILLICAVAASSAFADPPLNPQGYIDGEGIRFDPSTGDYIVTYYGSSPQGDRLVTLTYDTPNKIKPGVRTKLSSTKGRDISYNYDISNGRHAKQDIYAFGFTTRVSWWENTNLVTNASAASQAGVGNMPGVAQAVEARVSYTRAIESTRMKQSAKWLPEIAFSKSNQAVRFSWQAHPNKQPLDDIKPGQARHDFGLVVPYLPGLVIFEFEGNSKPFKFAGSAGGDSKIWKDIDKLLFGSTAPASSVHSLGPKVLIPEPFNAKLLATAIGNDLASWVEAGQLSEPLAQRLRGALAVVGSAAELNNTAAVTGNVERILSDLFSRHDSMRNEDVEDDSEDEENRKPKTENRKPTNPDLSRLAARAIAFNVMELKRRFMAQQLPKAR